MKDILCRILSNFKKAEYKIHVMHTSMQGDMFLQIHSFFLDIYTYISNQIDNIMEDMEQLGFDVPTNLKEIINEESDDDNVIELSTQEKNIKNQLQLLENTLITLIDILQEGIITSGEAKDYVIQNNLIDYQKSLRVFEWKTRRILGNK